MIIKFTEYRRDDRTFKRIPYRAFTVIGDTEEECFTKIYTGHIRPSRYCSGVYYYINDAEQQKRFDEWKQHGITFEMYYGNATVD